MTELIDSAKTCHLYYNNPVQHEAAGILVRSKLSAISQRLGFPSAKRERMAVVVGEMVTNQVKYAGGKGMIQVWEQPGPTLDILALDYGPGIANLNQAQEDGFSTGNTLGKGLGSIKRMSDQACIYTSAANGAKQEKIWTGTAVLARFHAGNGKVAKPTENLGLFARALSDDRYNGDHIYARIKPEQTRWVHMDGLGHGQAANQATSNLMGCVDNEMQPNALIHCLDERLRSSRGAVAILTELDAKTRRLSIHGIGDMQAFVVQGDKMNRYSFSPGVLGKEFKMPNPVQVELGKNAVVITVSDGIRRSWDENSFPGLFNQHPQLIAYVLGNIMARISDDQSLCVMRLP